MSPCVGTVDHVRLVVGILGELGQNSFEDASLVPPSEARVDGLPWTETFGEIAPGNAGLRDVEKGVQEDPIGKNRRPAGFPLFSWKQWFETIPLTVTQFMTMHRERRSCSMLRIKSVLSEFEDRP
jgi:hypothetical protein